MLCAVAGVGAGVRAGCCCPGAQGCRVAALGAVNGRGAAFWRCWAGSLVRLARGRRQPPDASADRGRGRGRAPCGAC